MSLFTIEQYDLIRRVRESGLTKDQVIDAFDQFEKLEPKELTSTNVTERVTCEATTNYSPSGSAPASGARSSTPASASSVGSWQSPGQGECTQIKPVQKRSRPSSDPPAKRHLPASGSRPMPHGLSAGSASAAARMLPVNQTGSVAALLGRSEVAGSQNCTTAAGAGTFTPSSQTSTSCHIASTPDRVPWLGGGSDPQPEPNSWMNNHTPASVNRNCLDDDYGYMLQQNFMATASSLMRKAAGASANRLNHQAHTPPQHPMGVWPPDMSGSDAALLANNAGPKSRFIFKKAHVSVLERHFHENPYPDGQLRHEIAAACNAACPYSSKLVNGVRQAMPVTPTMVFNWFSNRRKVVKKAEGRLRRSPADAETVGSPMPGQDMEMAAFKSSNLPTDKSNSSECDPYTSGASFPDKHGSNSVNYTEGSNSSSYKSGGGTAASDLESPVQGGGDLMDDLWASKILYDITASSASGATFPEPIPATVEDREESRSESAAGETSSGPAGIIVKMEPVEEDASLATVVTGVQ